MNEAITTASTLAFFATCKPITIQTDASKRGVGATLLQHGRPVAYASKSLTETESNYCNIERGMLGIVFGLERFQHYAYGHHVTIETDHKPLESITRKHLMNTPARLMRMLLRIQKYDITVKYVPGKDIPIADELSRLPIQGDEIPDINVTIHEIAGVSESRLGWALPDETEKLLSPHWRGFEEYAKPKSSFRVSRFQLRALKEEENKTIDAYMTRARIVVNDAPYRTKTGRCVRPPKRLDL